MILVVGATGQLGTAVVRKLVQREGSVRALVRRGAAFEHLKLPGVELAFGDLRDPASLEAACRGVATVIATANTVGPRGRYSFEAVEGEGYRSLIAAARRGGVGQFVLISVPVTPIDDRIPTFRYKRLAEEELKRSGLSYTIFRASLFMDCWLALLGTSLPLHGEEAPTLGRPFWFSKTFMKGIGGLIEKRGIALVPGRGDRSHAFIALDDVASFLVNAVGHPAAENATYDLGGPEILAWSEAVGIFSRVLDRPVRAVRAPAAMFRAQAMALRPFSPAAANLMAMNWFAATIDTPFDSLDLADTFGVRMTGVEEFLRGKLAHRDAPAPLPGVHGVPADAPTS